MPEKPITEVDLYVLSLSVVVRKFT